jgi:hypothetical protein
LPPSIVEILSIWASETTFALLLTLDHISREFYMQGIHSFDGFLNILTAFFGEDAESFGIIFFDVNHVVLFVIRYELNKG